MLGLGKFGERFHLASGGQFPPHSLLVSLPEPSTHNLDLFFKVLQFYSVLKLPDFSNAFFPLTDIISSAPFLQSFAFVFHGNNKQ